MKQETRDEESREDEEEINANPPPTLPRAHDGASRNCIIGLRQVTTQDYGHRKKAEQIERHETRHFGHGFIGGVIIGVFGTLLKCRCPSFYNPGLMLLLSSPRFGEHVTPPGHPERLERAEVFDAVARAWRGRKGNIRDPRPATREELARVHIPAYIDQIAETAGKPSMLDPDTFTSPESYDIALLAAGATVDAARHAVDTKEAAVALVRPPGHHAERDRAMGFCFFNNVAVAAADVIARGLERVAVVDIDVHHGNGTQWMFYDDPRVLYISSHQYPFYPGTGAATEVGHGPGAGFTVNIPLEAGATDGDFDLVYRTLAVPILQEFEPQLTLISAGYDAHEADPLAQMRMSAAGYARIIARLRLAAQQTGPLALVIEGGYDLSALRECLESTIEILEADSVGNPDAGIVEPTRRGEQTLSAVRAARASFWPGL
jgi:acetoin utilization deacetylase AcuC-like enzyme